MATTPAPPTSSMRSRRLRLLFVYALLAVPAVAWGAIKALETHVNSPLDWVGADFAPRAEYDEFVRRFGPGDVVVASWDGCTLDEPRLDALLEDLRRSAAFRDDDDRWLLAGAVSGRELLLRMTNGPHAIPRDEAVRRLRGSFVGPDERTTAVVATFTAEGLRRRGPLVAELRKSIERTCGTAADDLHLAGPVVDGLSVDEAGRASLDRLALPSALVVLVMACVCLRSVRAGLTVFLLALYCQAATLALIHFGGESMSALLTVVPPLIQVLAVAGGIHLANYWFETARTHPADEAPWEAVRLGALPCLLSSGTTALGIGSLMTSGLTPIRTFGAFGAAGVLATTGLLLTVVPAALGFIHPRRPVRDAGSGNDTVPGRGAAPHGTAPVGLWSRAARLVPACGPGVLFVAGVAMAAGAAGLPHLRTSVRIETLFGADSRILQDARWLERRLGPLVPIEVVVTYPPQSTTPHAERMSQIWRIRKALGATEGVDATFSAVELIPPLPPRAALPPEAYREAVERILAAVRPACVESGRLAVDDDGEHWRITASVSSLAPLDYGLFLERVREAVAPVVEGDAPPAVRRTGIMPLVHEIQRRLLRDLFSSFLGAFVLVTLVMTFAVGGFRAGLVAMIPNVFPTLILFGALGWSGIALDVGTVMTASVALGIAVDDTLHYLAFYQRALGTGMDRETAVGHAYRHCGTAMVQTSVVCGLGLLTFAPSEFVPTSRFAWVSVVLIALALLGDLVILPSLLLSPLGRLFGADAPQAEDFAAPPEAILPVALSPATASGETVSRDSAPIDPAGPDSALRGPHATFASESFSSSTLREHRGSARPFGA